ncbi:TIGR02466 family protein [Marivita sp.]|uniref:TIGR02466 family protein n=1 Tax=Marivita sp. TaxID=2003365 RepID=UPI003F707FCF
MSDANQAKMNMTMAFASPIVKVELPNPDALNQKLTAESHALRQESEGTVRSNRQGWHSDTDLMTRPEPGFTQLREFISKVVNTATRSLSPDFDFSAHQLAVMGWVNINPQHAYNVPHEHGGFLWSGCYYVNQPKIDSGPSGSIEFLSPLMVSAEFEILGAKCFDRRITVRPKAGDLLLFPSYLMHWVYPNDADAERITIAFNCNYVKK